MRYGIAVGGPLGALGDLARRCEDAGFESLWIAETSRTAFVQAAIAAQATERIRIGTSIALAFPRSPVITAMAARDVAELSGGRFVLGLGTQVKRVNQFRYATGFEHPAPKMREVIEVCRAVWDSFAGQPIDHRGRFYTVTMSPFPGAGAAPGPIPVHLAAVNEHMVRLAGEVCDGFLGHPFTSARYLAEVVRPRLTEAAARAGRDLDEVEVAQSVIVRIGDREQALAEAKLQIAFYATTRTYRGVLDLHGWGEVVDPLREAHAAGDLVRMVGLITDEMAETYAVVGTPEEARAQMRRFDGLADTIILNPPWAAGDEGRGGEIYGQLLETFGS